MALLSRSRVTFQASAFPQGADFKTLREAEDENAAISRAAEPMPARIAPGRRLRMFPLLIILAAVAAAAMLGRVRWDAYMGARGRATARKRTTCCRSSIRPTTRLR